MFSRRQVLAMTPLASAAALRRTRRVPAGASQPATPVTFSVPPGACDCHTHVFGDPRRFPFTPARTYTPESASVDEMRKLHRALHTTRVVIVQPSVYGTDNACTLDAIRQLGADARGIAVIDEQTTDAALDEMDRAGIRGIRINLATTGQTDPDLGRRRFEAAVTRIRNRKWHIQMYTQLSVIAAMRKDIAASPVPVVFDHFGGAQAAAGTAQAGFDVLLDLVRTGQAYVKVSAPYRWFHERAGLRGHGAVGQGADHGKRSADPVGHRLAPSRHRDGTAGHGRFAAPSDRRRTRVQSVLEVGVNGG